MIRILRILLLAIGMLTVMTQFCASESIFPTHSATVTVPEVKYALFMSKLDTAMNKLGFHRFESGAALKELLGQNTVYFEYKEEETSQWAFLTANDVMKIGRFNLRIYAQAVKDLKMKEDALTSVGQVLSQFGARLELMPGNIEQIPAE